MKNSFIKILKFLERAFIGNIDESISKNHMNSLHWRAKVIGITIFIGYLLHLIIPFNLV